MTCIMYLFMLIFWRGENVNNINNIEMFLQVSRGFVLELNTDKLNI